MVYYPPFKANQNKVEYRIAVLKLNLLSLLQELLGDKPGGIGYSSCETLNRELMQQAASFIVHYNAQSKP